MTRKTNTDLIQVKLNLAAKYERLAAIAGSQPKKRAFRSRITKLRRQAEQLKMQ